MPGIGTAAILGMAVSGGASVTSGIIGARAAGRAGRTQAVAAERAAELTAQSARESLDFQKQVYGQSRQDFAPFLGTGQAGMANLSYLMGMPQGALQERITELGGAVPGQAAAPGRPPLPSNLMARRQGGVIDVEGRVVDGGGGLPLGAERLLTGATPGATAGPGGVVPINRDDVFQQPPAGGFVEGAVGEDGRALPGGVVPATAGAGGPAVGPDGQPLPPGGVAPGAVGGGEFDLNALVNPELGEFGSLMEGFREFEAPTGITMENDPGYEFRLQEGLDALENSAAARGGLLTGAQGQAMTRYGQEYASGEFQNVYNRALTGYNTAYNVFQQNQANQYNRLMGLATGGQVTAGQLSNVGMGTASNVGNILMGSAGSIGNAYQNAAAARASGYVGGANSYQQMLQNLMKQLPS